LSAACLSCTFRIRRILAGIAIFCRELCVEILSMKGVYKTEKLFRDIRDELQSQLGGELPLLVNMIPSLKEIIGELTFAHDDTVGQQGYEEAKNHRFHYAFRRFMRVVVVCRFAPLVIFLDDLQWADLATLELLGMLIGDREVPNLMVVCCYRSNELKETDRLSTLVRDIKKVGGEESGDLSMTEIEIGNLALPEVNQIFPWMIRESFVLPKLFATRKHMVTSSSSSNSFLHCIKSTSWNFLWELPSGLGTNPRLRIGH
jgi:predicted ATPase